MLTSKYKLSENQADYILKTTNQGCMSGGYIGVGDIAASETFSYSDNLSRINDIIKFAPNHAWISKNEDNPQSSNLDNFNRPVNMSKIIIDADGNLSYVGGQKFICGVDKIILGNDPSTSKIITKNSHT